MIILTDKDSNEMQHYKDEDSFKSIYEIMFNTTQVCLGPVTDQSRGNRVIEGFVQGFGISGLFSNEKGKIKNGKYP